VISFTYIKYINTFNYDRSLDHFLYNSFLNTFSDGRIQFKGSIKEYIPQIIHVYGQVDRVKWDGGFDYKASYDLGIIEFLQQNIKVFYEIHGLNPKISEIISNHKRIFFLGFGYADENMKLIGMPGSLNEKYEIYGTAYEMTPKEIIKLTASFKNMLPEGVQFECLVIQNKTCYELLNEYL
jgi:hypothetical protein